MKKRILFRADGNSEIGLGHLYRLFSLVEMLKDAYEFFFLTRSNSELSIFPKEYELKLIPDSINLEEEVDWISEKFDSNNSILILDGYQFHSYYQRRIKIKGFQLIYIDDLAEEHMYADIVVNHASSSKNSDYSKEKYVRLALGFDYAMLRPSFLNEAQKQRVILNVESVFVCFGGADSLDFTTKIVELLLEIEEIKNINVVVGAANKSQNIDLLKKNIEVNICKNLDEIKMRDLMLNSDLAILPTSTILFEALCVNMFLISGYYVDNQKKAYYDLNKRSIIEGIGDFRNGNFSKIKDIITSLDKEKINNQLRLQSEVIKGNQKNNFISLIKSLN